MSLHVEVYRRKPCSDRISFHAVKFGIRLMPSPQRALVELFQKRSDPVCGDLHFLLLLEVTHKLDGRWNTESG